MDVPNPMDSTGWIDLTWSGGTPCITQDSLVGPSLGGNGFAGNNFNITNTSGGPLNILGFTQLGTITTTQVMDVYYYPGDYTNALATTNGWTLVGSANVVTGPGGQMIPVTGVTIPAGATWGFRVGGVGSIKYTNGTGVAGVTPWFSNSFLTVSEGHGGASPFYEAFSPRNWNGIVPYGDPSVSAYTSLWST